MTVPQITPLSDPPNRADPVNFVERSDTFMGELPGLALEMNVAITFVNSRAEAAEAAIPAAQAKVELANNAAQVAMGASNYKGEYNPATLYTVGQSVSVGAAVYIKKTNAPAGTTPVDGTDWRTVPVSSLPRVELTSNVQLNFTHSGYLVRVLSGTFTQTADTANSLGSGWWCFYYNTGEGVITFDPAGSETVDGSASIQIYPRDFLLIQCDGTKFTTALLGGNSVVPAYPNGTLRPGAMNVATTFGDFTVPTLKAGVALGFLKEADPTATNLKSPDGWTYVSDTTAGTRAFSLQGTGTLRPHVGNPPVSGIAPPYLESSDTISLFGKFLQVFETASAYYGIYAGVATRPVFKVAKSTGVPQLVTVQNGTSNTLSDTSACGIWPSEASGKVAYAVVNSAGLTCGLSNSSTGGSIVYTLAESATVYHGDFLSESLYAYRYGNNVNTVVFNHSTSTVSKTGTLAITCPGAAVIRINATQFLYAGGRTAGGVIDAAVCTVSGGTITRGTVASSTGTDNSASEAGTSRLHKLSDTKYILFVAKQSNNAHTYAYGITVSDTTVTISDSYSFTSKITFGSEYTGFGNEACVPVNYAVIDQDRLLVRSSLGKVSVVKFSGGVITEGTQMAATYTGLFKGREATPNFYALTGNSFSKLIISDTTITIDYTVNTNAPKTLIFNEGLTSAAFRSPEGNWYSWDLALSNTNGSAVISADRYVALNSNNNKLAAFNTITL